MFNKTKPTRDAFTSSPGGMTTIASFVAAPAVANNQLYKTRDELLDELNEDQPDTAKEIAASWGRFWLAARRRAA